MVLSLFRLTGQGRPDRLLLVCLLAGCAALIPCRVMGEELKSVQILPIISSERQSAAAAGEGQAGASPATELERILQLSGKYWQAAKPAYAETIDEFTARLDHQPQGLTIQQQRDQLKPYAHQYMDLKMREAAAPRFSLANESRADLVEQQARLFDELIDALNGDLLVDWPQSVRTLEQSIGKLDIKLADLRREQTAAATGGLNYRKSEARLEREMTRLETSRASLENLRQALQRHLPRQLQQGIGLQLTPAQQSVLFSRADGELISRNLALVNLAIRLDNPDAWPPANDRDRLALHGLLNGLLAHQFQDYLDRMEASGLSRDFELAEGELAWLYEQQAGVLQAQQAATHGIARTVSAYQRMTESDMDDIATNNMATQDATEDSPQMESTPDDWLAQAPLHWQAMAIRTQPRGGNQPDSTLLVVD